MSRRQWSKVALGGERHLIPKVCPNCLAPSEVERRYAYKAPWWLWIIDSARYIQTFYYCRDCGAQAGAYTWYHKWVSRVRFPFAVLSLAALVALGELLGRMSRGLPNDSPLPPWGTAALLPAALVVWWGLCRWLKRRALVSAPILEKQAVWGPAVYYTGDRGFGLLDLFAGASRSVYRAARPEWIRALVEANPEKVDDATYRDAVGAEKPVFAVDRRSAT
ncbi:MAG: hypothetical protein ACLQLG_15695 [Thermoguttaceae bacterium]